MRRNVYLSQHGFADYFPGEGAIVVLESWLFAGVLLVVLDTLRRKTESEEKVWRIAAIAFGLTAVGLGVNFAIGGYGKILYGSGAAGLGEAITLILQALALFGVYFFGVTQMFGAPAYTVYLTIRSVHTWRAYLRAT